MVNETLSDTSTMAETFPETGAPASLAKLWFASILRDGFALTAAGANPSFTEIGIESLRELLPGAGITSGLEETIRHIRAGMASLSLHPDVAEGVQTLKTGGFRLITLTNGSTHLAETMFAQAGILSEFEALLSVDQAPAWNPHPASYASTPRKCAGRPPEQMLLAAVHPWDIHGAARAGMQIACINRAGASYPAYFKTPNHSLAALTDLVQVLQRVN